VRDVLQRLTRRAAVRRQRMLPIAVTVPFVLALVSPTIGASAQQGFMHLNPAVAKLAAGDPIIGTSTTDLTLANCHSLSRLEMDYVYVDMEHGPLNLEGLAHCVAAMVDKAWTLKQGNAKQKVALFARFPPYGHDLGGNAWIVKQALDIGLSGVIFNTIDTKEQLIHALQYMRYPQQKTSKYPNPQGLRGYGPGNAVFAWGISSAEYERRADLWPLNPEGDLLAIAMIETTEALKNVNDIASVPGLGAIFIGAGADLRQSLGVPGDAPELEAARQIILQACLKQKVACGITATGQAEVDRRLKEGWKMIRRER
jgi:4-hydroxy-2-oxoheptanedioate aldolase